MDCMTIDTSARPQRRRRTKSEEDLVIEQALAILRRRMVTREVFASPSAVKTFVQLAIARRDHEVFSVLFLDSQNRLITFEELFRGTLTQTSVYPREIVKRALELGAAGVILAHNHPSGVVQPSLADETLTKTLKAALALVDVRTLDHIVVAPGMAFSMTEAGLL
jgi:DNA repair protein RadC